MNNNFKYTLKKHLKKREKNIFKHIKQKKSTLNDAYEKKKSIVI